MPSQREPERIHQRRWPWIVSLGLIAAIVAGMILLVTHWPFTPDKIQGELRSRLAGNLQVGSYRQVYFPRPGCVLEGVVLSTADRAEPLFTARELTIEGSYSSMLTTPHHLRIGAQGAHISLKPGANGVFRQQGTMPKTIVDDLEAHDLVLDVGRIGNPPLRFEIHQLEAGPMAENKAMRFEAKLTNPLPRGAVQTSGVIGPWNRRDAGSTPVSGSYQLTGADLGVFASIGGSLSSSGNFSGALSKIGVTGKLQVADFVVRASGHPVNLTAQFQADVNATSGDVLLRHSAVSWRNTTLIATGPIAGQPGQQGKTVALDVQVDRGRIEDLMRLVMRSEPTMNGRAAFRGNVVWPPGAGKFIEKIQFTADFDIDHARFTREQVQQNVNKLSERARGDKDNDPESVLTNLKGHLLLQRGVARLTNGEFAVPAAVAEFGGTCDMLSRGLNMQGHLRMKATVSQATTGLKSVLLKVMVPFFRNRKRSAGSDVPVKLAGTISHPQIGVDLP